MVQMRSDKDLHEVVATEMERRERACRGGIVMGLQYVRG